MYVGLQDRVNVFDFVLVVTMVGALVAEHLNYYTASSILGYTHNVLSISIYTRTDKTIQTQREHVKVTMQLPLKTGARLVHCEEDNKFLRLNSPYRPCTATRLNPLLVPVCNV